MIVKRENPQITQLREQVNRNPEHAADAVLAAAEAGDVDAQVLLGQMLLEGRGIARDPALALRWFQSAAKLKHPMALNLIGRCLEHGLGCRQNVEDAAAYYRVSAEMGLDWGLYHYANLMITGQGKVPRDAAHAVVLYQRAAETGHAMSMHMLGCCYEDGVGVPVDIDQAQQWYRRAAESGDFRAQYRHAATLIAQDDIEGAAPWLDSVRANGNLKFLRSIRTELLTSPDARLRAYAEAFHERAAELGDSSDRDAWIIARVGTASASTTQ
ncbi:tetratricopeptide repeat protein [Solimonas marina]|nr:tetratricopeptide repeat protein [Solimonas marina]